MTLPKLRHLGIIRLCLVLGFVLLGTGAPAWGQPEGSKREVGTPIKGRGTGWEVGWYDENGDKTKVEVFENGEKIKVIDCKENLSDCEDALTEE